MSNDKMRAEFEAWVHDRYTHPGLVLRHAWDAWQAALSQQPVQPAPPTLDQIELMVQSMVERNEITWLGFLRDVDGRYTNPVISDSHYKLVLGAIKHFAQLVQPKETKMKIPTDEYGKRLYAVLEIIRAYLPPDSGITAKDALSEIIGLVDPWPEVAQPVQPKESK